MLAFSSLTLVMIFTMRNRIYLQQAALAGLGLATSAGIGYFLGISPLASGISLAAALGSHFKSAYDSAQAQRASEEPQKDHENQLIVKQASKLSLTQSLSDEVFELAKMEPAVLLHDPTPRFNMWASSKYEALTTNHYVTVTTPIVQDLLDQQISVQQFQALIGHEAGHLQIFDSVFTTLNAVPVDWLKKSIELQQFLNFATVLTGSATWSAMFSGFAGLMMPYLIAKGVNAVGNLPLLMIAHKIKLLKEHACDIYSAEILSATYMIEALRYISPYSHSEAHYDTLLADQPAFLRNILKFHLTLFNNSHPEIEQRIQLLEKYRQAHPEVIPDGREFIFTTEVPEIEELPMNVPIEANASLEEQPEQSLEVPEPILEQPLEDPEPILEQPQGMLLQFNANRSKRKKPTIDLPVNNENDLNIPNRTTARKATRSGMRY